jgi:tetratricopeptide (TPR) repeat protein
VRGKYDIGERRGAWWAAAQLLTSTTRKRRNFIRIGRIGTRIAIVTLSVAISGLLGACYDDTGKVSDHLEKASRYIYKADSPAAIPELKSALQLDIDNFAARLMLGRAYLTAGLGAAARKGLDAAHRLGGDDAQLPLDIVRSMIMAGEFDDALKAIEQDSSETVRWKTVADFAQLGKQQVELARGLFEQALELGPDDTEARRGLAQSMFAGGAADLAKSQLEQALQHNDTKSRPGYSRESWSLRCKTCPLRKRRLQK